MSAIPLHDAFLMAIREAPDDDVPRLVYADLRQLRDLNLAVNPLGRAASRPLVASSMLAELQHLQLGLAELTEEQKGHLRKTLGARVEL
jgi:hypothetical protein